MFRRGRTKPIIPPSYIVGLTDGEGCFYVLVRPPYNQKGGALVELKFFIKLKKTDREILEKVKRSLGCGSVYFQHEKRENHAQCYRYTVGSHQDIFKRIVPFFKKHSLQTKSKKRSFKIFCKIANLVKSGKHHNRKGINLIQRLKLTINANSRTRVVREIRTLRGNSKQLQLSKSARHVKRAGSTRSAKQLELR